MHRRGAWSVRSLLPSGPSDAPEPATVGDVEGVARIVAKLKVEEPIASAPVVAFGESTHGTAEFRHVFFEYALARAADEDEVTIALELPPVWAANLNESIEGCGSLGLGDAAAGRFQWFAPGSDFVRRARAHNRHSSGCIRVVGVDSPTNVHSSAMLAHFGAACMGNGWTAELNRTVARLDALSGRYGIETELALELVETIDGAYQRSEHHGRCVDFEWWVSRMRRRVATKESDLEGWPVPRYTTTVDRDLDMADGVTFWAEHASGPVLFLAHAGHVSEQPIVWDHRDGHSRPAGVLLDSRFGDAYASVALAFGSGTLYANACVGRQRGSVRTIPPPSRPSLQRDLVRRYPSPELLPLPSVCQSADCSRWRIFVFCLPRGWSDPKVSYESLELGEAFDWLVFFPTATAAEPG